LRFAASAAILLAAWTSAALAEQPAPIAFNGLSFDFRAMGHINNGWGVYYAPGGQDPDQAHDEIIVNYLDRTDGKGNAITAQGMAESMLGSIRAQGGTLVLPFTAPDPAYKGRLSYYMAFYYVYPQDKNGDIWAARVVQDDERALGVLYKHRIDGTDAADIEAKIVAWLKDNMGKMPIDHLAIPPEPPHG
jgi:hypothetical protein